MKEICSNDSKPELITEGISKISNDKRVSEIYFIESVRLMAQILKKKEKDLLLYDQKLLQADMESKNSHLIPLFNMKNY